MKLLLVNANMTQAVTDHVVAEARRCAQPGTIITGVTARYGASIVTAEPENVIASYAALDLLAEHYADYDAAILAISFDSGLFAARDLVPIPVLGMTEAALTAAADYAPCIGVIVFGRVSLPLYETLFARYPVKDAIAAIRVVEIASVQDYLKTNTLEQTLLDTIAALAAEGLNAVVICGAAMAGMAHRLQPKTNTRLFDGISCAVAQAEALVASGHGQPSPRNPLATTSVITGVSPALQTLFIKRNSPG